MTVGVAGNRTRYQSGVYDSTCESGQFCQDEWYRDNKCLLASQIYRFCMSGTFFFRESNEPCEDSEWKNGCLQPIFPGTGFIGRMPATEKERSGIEVASTTRAGSVYIVLNMATIFMTQIPRVKRRTYYV